MLSPFLSTDAAAAVTSAAQDWQELCVLRDKLRRCELCLPGAQIGAADGEVDRTLRRAAEELCSSTYAELQRGVRPAWLAFQARSLYSARQRVAVAALRAL